MSSLAGAKMSVSVNNSRTTCLFIFQWHALGIALHALSGRTHSPWNMNPENGTTPAIIAASRIRADLRNVHLPADVAEGTGSRRALAAAARRYRCERGTFCKCQERCCTTTARLRDGVDAHRPADAARRQSRPTYCAPSERGPAVDWMSKARLHSARRACAVVCARAWRPQFRPRHHFAVACCVPSPAAPAHSDPPAQRRCL